MKPFSNSTRTVLYYRLPVIALCLAIFWQSSFPGIIQKQVFEFQDKWLHFCAYACLAFLTARCLAKDKPLWKPSGIRLAAIAFASLYGLSDEIHQAFVPGRYAGIGDFIADMAGSIAGAVFFIDFIYRRRQKNR